VVATKPLVVQRGGGFDKVSVPSNDPIQASIGWFHQDWMLKPVLAAVRG
jgi:hypothetical protein